MRLVTPDTGKRPTYTATEEQRQKVKEHLAKHPMPVRTKKEAAAETATKPEQSKPLAPVIKKCAEHRVYATQREAEQCLGKVAHLALKSGRDEDTWQLLAVFACGDHWHIGRDWLGLRK